MEKTYRDLFEAVAKDSREAPALVTLLGSIEEVDDLDPLRVPAMKAMRRDPVPPLNLIYERTPSQLALFARNIIRKRKAPHPAQVVAIDAPDWLFDAHAAFPGTLEQRNRFVELVSKSFGYLEIRIRNYFEFGYDSELKDSKEGATAVLKIETVQAHPQQAEREAERRANP